MSGFGLLWDMVFIQANDPSSHTHIYCCTCLKCGNGVSGAERPRGNGVSVDLHVVGDMRGQFFHHQLCLVSLPCLIIP